MKKVLILVAGLIVVLGVFLITAKKDNGEDGSTNKIKVVTTTTMITDLVKYIAKDKIEVNGLMGAGVDPHLYKASEVDVTKLSEADAIIYNGLHLEGKLVEIFEKMEHKGKEVYSLAETIDDDKLILSEDFAGNYDPHIWFSTQIWKQVAEYAGEILSEIDPENAGFYKTNAHEYAETIEEFEKNHLKKYLNSQKIKKFLLRRMTHLIILEKYMVLKL
jgi:manganese/zinc/iron transport system substrate-binding protein